MSTIEVVGAVAVPFISGGFALVGSKLGARQELSKVGLERFNQRERDFEAALVGYRKCYQKFLLNIAAYHAKTFGWDKQEVTPSVILDNFWEAYFIGDPEVMHELERYWPVVERNTRRPPEGDPPKELIEAMQAHGSRTLEEQLAHQENYQPPSPPQLPDAGA